MKNLAEKLNQNQALTKPASDEQIEFAQSALGIKFSDEYKDFLRIFGVISYNAIEIYGLGVPNTSYLNILTQIHDMKELESSFPDNLIPLSEIGDGHFYMYDNLNQNIIIWVSPNGGIAKKTDEKLEDFLIELLFN